MVVRKLAKVAKKIVKTPLTVSKGIIKHRRKVAAGVLGTGVALTALAKVKPGAAMSVLKGLGKAEKAVRMMKR